MLSRGCDSAVRAVAVAVQRSIRGCDAQCSPVVRLNEDERIVPVRDLVQREVDVCRRRGGIGIYVRGAV